ncbi:MAG: hypothetical protein QM446_05845, partial [Synergistota bacterium]|nr:hypothetical protein [Synergistota bacterium]
SFLSVLCLEGGATLLRGDGRMEVAKGDSLFIPAGEGELIMDGAGSLLLTGAGHDPRDPEVERTGSF